MTKGLRFVEHISPVYLEQLNEISVEKWVPVGTVLFMDGEKADQLFLIKEGQLKLSKATSDGKELTLQVFAAGDLVGVTGLFGQDFTYSATGIMLESGTVRVIPRSNLEHILISNGEFCAQLLRWMTVMNCRLQSKFRDLLLNGKTGALYSTLIRMCNTFGEKREDGIWINLSMTNRDLAQFIGLTRETCNRILSDLKKQGIIEMHPQGHLLVKDLDYLKKAICCDNCPPEICQI